VIEVTYLAEVLCEISVPNGILDTQVVGVPDVDGNRQFLRVGKGMVTEEGGKTYLPVGIVELDRKSRKALVELPLEADSGFRRLWVPFDNFRVKR
jgi:hypothetical protein